MNAYLRAKRASYDELRSSIEAVQTRAAEEDRDLSDTELTLVREQGEQARALADQITELSEIESRHAKVAELASSVDSDTETRGKVTHLGTQATDRDPGHYVRGGGNSFFGDMFAARSVGDDAASRRLTEHSRALTALDEGPGVVPPTWMTAEFAEIARQQRRVASAVRNIAITNAAPIVLPRQTAESGTVAEQVNEESATSFTDGWDSAITTIQPKATSGGQKVTRTLLESSTPAVDELIWSDLIASYNTKIESKVVAAMVTSAGAATVTYANETAWTTGLNPTVATAVDGAVLDCAIAVRNGRKLPADIVVPSVLRYGSFLKMKDSSGRPLIPSDSGGAMNVIGTGSVAVDGRLHGLGVLASDGVTQYPESVLVARASDTILFESSTLRFRYDEPDGPEIIRLGIWAYSAVHVKYAGLSVKRIQITAA